MSYVQVSERVAEDAAEEEAYIMIGFDSALPNWHDQIVGMWKRRQTPAETVESLFELEWWNAIDYMVRMSEE